MRRVNFEDGNIAKDIAQTAIPMLAAQILNLLYSIVDRIYIGRIPGEGTSALGGIGLCFPIIILVTGFANMYGMGGAPVFSMELGRRHEKTAESIMNTAFRLICVTGTVIIIAGEVFASPMLRLFGASEQVIGYSLSYLRIYLTGTLFAMIATGMNPFINAQGFSGVGMMSVVIGAGCNLMLDPLLIYVFHMGVAGAALATVISQGLSAVYALRFAMGKKAVCRLRFQKEACWSAYFPYARQIVGLGTASFIMQCTNSLVQIACNNVLMVFGGEIYVSIMTIISSVRQMLETPLSAVTEGTSPVISYNYGAGRASNVKKAILYMTSVSMCYTLIVWILIERFPQMFIGIFSSDEMLLDKAVSALHLYFYAFIFQTLQMSGQTVFKSLNKKKQAIFFSLFRKVIMVVPLTFLLPYVFGFGAEGVFIAEPISNVVGGVACFSSMLFLIIPELKRLGGSGTV